MKKYKLKLFQSNGHNSELKIFNKKNENIFPITTAIELKNGNIYVSYKEIEINKCGFDEIEKVEIHKNGKIIFSNDKVLDYCAEFPMLVHEGIYEIRTLILNLKNNYKTFIINTFEFFSHSTKVICEDFKINLNKVNGSLYINFNKKIGNIDLSEISLSNINLYDSKFNQIKNVACKLYSRFNGIDFVILDIFNDNNLNKLIPNEVYILEINVKGRKIMSSFLFEYGNIEMKSYKIVEAVDYEFISDISMDMILVKLYFKMNKFINLDDYEYFISNIRNKFLFKMSSGNNEDTLVFEGILRRGKNYFELSVCRGESVNIIKFNYDFTFKDGKIFENDYFDLPLIQKVSGNHCIFSRVKTLNKSLTNYSPFLLSSGGIKEKGTVNRNGELIFNQVNILNKFSKIYTIELDHENRESFVFSPSVGVNFKKINYDIFFGDGKVNINFKEKIDITGSYRCFDSSEKNLKVLNNVSVVKVEELNRLTIIYLKIYGENNKVYFETIVLDSIQIEASIKICNSEKVSLNTLNSLTIFDKNIFDNLKNGFEVMLLNSNGFIGKVFVENFDDRFKIRFENLKLFDGMHYVKFQKGDFYKICSFFVRMVDKENVIFLRNLDKGSFGIFLYGANRKLFGKNLKIKMFLIMYENKYLLMEEDVLIKRNSFDVFIHEDILINGMEYLVEFMFGDSKSKIIWFTYLGENGLSYGDIFENTNALRDVLESAFEKN